MTAPEVRVLEVLGRSAGGIAGHVSQLTAALDGSDGIRIAIAAPPGLPIQMPKEINPISIPDGPLMGHRGAISKLRRLLRAWDIDVAHAHGLRAGIDTALAARGLGVDVLLTVHNLVRPEVAGRLKAPFYRWAELAATRLCRHTFCVSEDIARHLRAAVPSAAARIEVLYLGIEPPPEPRAPAAALRADLGIGDAAMIVTAARLAPQKALHVLLEALVSVPRAHLAVLGEGPLEAHLKQLARRLSVDERVHWLGFRKDAADVIAAGDVFCLSSVWEGVPLSAQEAILLGTPVVATEVGGMSELLSDGHSGRLVDPGDPAALAQALRTSLEDRDGAARMAKTARSELAARFSTSRMLDRLRRAYTEGIGVGR